MRTDDDDGLKHETQRGRQLSGETLIFIRGYKKQMVSRYQKGAFVTSPWKHLLLCASAWEQKGATLQRLTPLCLGMVFFKKKARVKMWLLSTFHFLKIYTSGI
jgi:hypothetical protein